MNPRAKVTRVLLGASLAALAIASQSVMFASGERQMRAPRSVHRTRQNCDQEFGARIHVPEAPSAAVSILAAAGDGAPHHEASLAILPAPAFAAVAEPAARVLAPETPDLLRSRPIASHSGRGPPVLA